MKLFYNNPRFHGIRVEDIYFSYLHTALFPLSLFLSLPVSVCLLLPLCLYFFAVFPEPWLIRYMAGVQFSSYCKCLRRLNCVCVCVPVWLMRQRPGCSPTPRPAGGAVLLLLEATGSGGQPSVCQSPGPAAPGGVRRLWSSPDPAPAALHSSSSAPLRSALL